MESALDYRIYKSYQVHQKIGKGTYGQVYRATDKKTSKSVAIKKIFDVFQNLTDAKRTYRQLSFLSQLSHPCIIKLIRIFSGQLAQNQYNSSNKNVYAVFELMEMDLAKIINICKLQPLQRKFIAFQLVCALNYLHQSGLVHRDIKPSNILLDSSCNTKICDFGLIRKISDFTQRDQNQQIFTEYVASRWYRAPEILINGSQLSTTEIDMWSYGCVLAEMILGQPIFQGKNTLQQLQIIFSRIGMPAQQQIENIGSEQGKFLLRNFHNLKNQSIQQVLINSDPLERDLIEKLLLFSPSRRLNCKQAMSHPYFDQIRSTISQFKEAPVKIHDHSINIGSCTINSKSMIEKYRQLIQSLCVNTYRTSNTSSKKTIKEQCYRQYRDYLKNGQKEETNMNLRQQFRVFKNIQSQHKQKSTRSSNCPKEDINFITTSDRSNKHKLRKSSKIKKHSDLQIIQHNQHNDTFIGIQQKQRKKSKNKSRFDHSRDSKLDSSKDKKSIVNIENCHKSRKKLILTNTTPNKSQTKNNKYLQKSSSVTLISHQKKHIQVVTNKSKPQNMVFNGSTKLIKRKQKV